jgi:hypothetical protein
MKERESINTPKVINHRLKFIFLSEFFLALPVMRFIHTFYGHLTVAIFRFSGSDDCTSTLMHQGCVFITLPSSKQGD